MSKYTFQIYFQFIVFLIISGNGISLENGTKEEILFSDQEYGSLRDKCAFGYNMFGDPGVTCNRVLDMSNFSSFMKSSEHCNGIPSCDVTFKDVKHIPARTFQGINVSNLYLDGPDITIDENIFEGSLSLRGIDVLRSNIKNIPDFSFVNAFIETVKMNASSLTALEGKNFQNLTKLWMLSFSHNFIRYIDPDFFKGTENVKFLTLSHNLLTSIPPTLLDGMKYRFKTFDVSYNNLLHVADLFKVMYPEDIDVSFNRIAAVESVLQLKTKNIPFELDQTYKMDLSGNPIKSITKGVFGEKRPHLNSLYLRHCQLESFYLDPGLYFFTLDMSYNSISDFGQDIGPISVMEFKMVANKFRNLAGFPKNSSIERVEFNQNQIQYLTDEDFKYIKHIMKLHLIQNRIQRIDSDTFLPLKSILRDLYLDGNLITSLNGSLRYMSRTYTVSLTYNSIEIFQEDEFEYTNSLSYLYLQHNRLKTVGQLRQLPNLKFFYVAYNNITLIKPEQLPKSLMVLDLKNNPLECNCNLQPLILMLNTSEYPSLAKIALCLESEFVGNGSQTSQCPGRCSCACVTSGSGSFMSVDCSSKNVSVLPQALKKEDAVIGQTVYPWLHLEDRILGINLENNHLESLEGIRLSSNLNRLLLANNSLRRLPESVLDNLLNLKQVSLSGNPWKCDCDALKFKKWLTSNFRIIDDVNDVRCSVGDTDFNGPVIRTLTDRDLCPSRLKMILSLTFGALVFVILCLAANFFYTRHRLSVNVFLWSHGLTFMKEEDVEYDKKFDAFLSFSNLDGEFVVKDVISVIEDRGPDIRLCIHYRDFRAGEYIYDNIEYAVQNSKKTVLFLSRNFLESEWCMKEFQMAIVQALKDRMHRVVVIKLGDLPKDIDPQIEVYLQRTTYLTWGEKHFWNKLLYILPTSSGIRNPEPGSLRKK